MRRPGIVLIALAAALLAACPSPTGGDPDGNGNAKSAPVVTGIDPVPSAEEPVLYPSTQTFDLLVETNDAEGTIYYRTVEELPNWIFIEDETVPTVAVATSLSDLQEGEKDQATVRFYASVNADPADDPAGGSSLDDWFETTVFIESTG